MSNPEPPQVPQFQTAEYAEQPAIIASVQPTQEHFARALLFGAVAAIAGAIGYAAFGIITGWMIGYISLGIGLLIGKAIMKGSGGVGGRRYQIAAVILTYLACSFGEGAVGIAQLIKEKPATAQADGKTAEKTDVKGDSSATSADASSGGLLISLAILIGIILAAPILGLSAPLQGLIGLVILFVGIRIAWQTTAGRPQSAHPPVV